jgi:hypothetical protein
MPGQKNVLKRAYSQCIDENAGYKKLKDNDGLGRRSFIQSQSDRSQPSNAPFNYDATQARNPDAVSEFAFDIFQYMRHREVSF